MKPGNERHILWNCHKTQVELERVGLPSLWIQSLWFDYFLRASQNQHSFEHPFAHPSQWMDQTYLGMALSFGIWMLQVDKKQKRSEEWMDMNGFYYVESGPLRWQCEIERLLFVAKRRFLCGICFRMLGVMLIMNGLIGWKSLAQHQRRSETIRVDQSRSTHDSGLRCSESVGSASRIEALSTLIASIQPGPHKSSHGGLWKLLLLVLQSPAFGTLELRYQGLRPLHCGLTVSAMALAACCRCFDRSHVEEVVRFSRQIQGTVLSCEGKSNDGNCGWRFYSLSRAKPQFVDSVLFVQWILTSWTSVNMKRLDHHAHSQTATCTVHTECPGRKGKLE